MAPLPRREDPPWYEKGLRFSCTECGKCCTGAPGYVWVTAADVARLAKAKGLTPDAFSKAYVRRVGGRLSLQERANGDCVMLEGKRCSVHEVKPRQCVTYPFWSETVDRPEDWEAEAAKCPGVGSGDLYTAAEIDALVQGVEAPMVEKQRARSRGRDEGPAAPPGPTEAQWAAALADLEAVYADLDAEMPRYKFVCQASGDCCDFDAFGHRLYATTLEAEWFFRNSPRQRMNANPRHCPAWGGDRLCKARAGRMLGCRTFHCGTNKNADPHEIYERYHRRIKEVHDRHGIPFRYADVVAWSAERRPA
jgi:Fe-S-cluster containining protein